MRNNVKNLTRSAMFLALAFVLPFLTGQIPQIGSMLCPMHIPVLLCGFFCGPAWGMAVGFFAPLLRSVVLGTPLMFPTACCMAFELATYGFAAGILYRLHPQKKSWTYISLICAMCLGRVIWGLAMLVCVGLDITKFTWTMFLSVAFFQAVPGIVIQIILIPILVFALDRGRE